MLKNDAFSEIDLSWKTVIIINSGRFGPKLLKASITA